MRSSGKIVIEAIQNINIDLVSSILIFVNITLSMFSNILNATSNIAVIEQKKRKKTRKSKQKPRKERKKKVKIVPIVHRISYPIHIIHVSIENYTYFTNQLWSNSRYVVFNSRNCWFFSRFFRFFVFLVESRATFK